MASVWTLYRNGSLSGGEDVTSLVSVGSVISERQDYALDEGKLVLAPLTNEQPLDPRTTALSFSDGSETLWYRVISDEVALVMRGAANAYSHTVQYASLSRDLAFSLIRGCDFKQPKNRGAASASSSSGFGNTKNDATSFHSTGTILSPYKINAHASVSAAYAVLKVQGAQTTSWAAAVISSQWVGVAASSGPTFGSASVVSCNSAGGSQTVLFAFPLTMAGKVALTASQLALINSAFANGLYVCVTAPSSVVSGSGFALISARLSIELETYYYTFADVISGLLAAAHRPSDSLFSISSPFSLPASGAFHDFIYNAVAPDFQFAQNMTLWDALSEVYRAFDAMPTLDGALTLGVKYFNDRAGSSPISVSSVADAASSLSDAGRSPALVCKYQNGYPLSKHSYPGLAGYAFPRSAVLGVPSPADFYFSSGKPIDVVLSLRARPYQVTVNRLNVWTAAEDAVQLYVTFPGEPVDCTAFVFEKTAWSLLGKTTNQTSYPTQYNSVWYEQGSADGVYLGGITKTVLSTVYSANAMVQAAFVASVGGGLSASVIFNSASSVKVWDLQLAMDYEAVTDGTVRVEGFSDKGSGEAAIAQAGQLPALPRLGSSMLGTVSQQGEAERSKLFPISSFAARPARGSWYRDDDGSMWIVQATKCTQYPTGWKCDAALVKDFNQLTKKISVDRKAAFTAISPSLSAQSEVIYQEYAYLCAAEPSEPANPPHFAQGLSFFAFSLLLSGADPNFSDYYRSPFAYVRGRWYTRPNTTSSTYLSSSAYCYLPLSVYGAGTCLCFEGSMPSAASAGNQLTVTSSTWFEDNLSSDAVPYCDPQGFADLFDFAVLVTSSPLNGAQATAYSAMPALTSSQIAVAASVASFSGLKAAKRPNDIMGFNYEIALLPLPSDGASQVFAYPALVERNFMSAGGGPAKVRLFANPVGGAPYSQFESQAYGAEVLGSFSLHETPGTATMAVVLYSGGSPVALPSAASGWMLAGEDGTPLLATNQSLAAGARVAFWLLGSHDRL